MLFAFIAHVWILAAIIGAFAYFLRYALLLLEEIFPIPAGIAVLFGKVVSVAMWHGAFFMIIYTVWSAWPSFFAAPWIPIFATPQYTNMCSMVCAIILGAMLLTAIGLFAAAVSTYSAPVIFAA